MEHARQLAAERISLIDVGTSGGVWGRERGYCLMIGGPEKPVNALAPLWDALAPGMDTQMRTDDSAPLQVAERGWLHCGPSGAGHYGKMVQTGIEYALMAAYAE